MKLTVLLTATCSVIYHLYDNGKYIPKVIIHQRMHKWLS